MEKQFSKSSTNCRRFAKSGECIFVEIQQVVVCGACSLETMAIESFFQLYKPVPVIAILVEDYRYVLLFFSHGGPNLCLSMIRLFVIMYNDSSYFTDICPKLILL